MIVLKKLWLLIFFLLSISCSYAQNINWMLGTWKGTGNPRASQFIRTIVIESISGSNFTGSRSKEANDHNHTKIVTAIAGEISKDTFYIKDGAIIFKKDPPHSKWFDCTQCVPFNRVIIAEDSILLSSTTADCQPLCNGTSVYFKLLPDFDTVTQRSLVDMFGTPEQIEAFQPFIKIIQPVASSDPDAIKQVDISGQPTISPVKTKQQYEDSLRIAGIANKKREQQILDSLKTEVEIARRRQQEMDDSLQYVANIKKQRQQQVDDSLQTVSKIDKQMRQQEIDDSLKNAALIAKQSQQRYDDSLKLVKRKQQELQDSLQTAALIAKKRQQQIDDSLQTVANIAKQKRQQQIDDSLKNAALIAKLNQQRYDDSLKLARRRQQQVADSLQIVATTAKQKRQQQSADSVRNAALIAKQKQQHYDDSVKVAQKRQQQIQDSLQNIVSINKIRQQEIDDSLKIAAGKRQIIPDTAKTAVAKSQANRNNALTQRDNVLLQTYHIKNPDILIELFDNAEIDGDRVSVFHNNSIIVNNQTLLREPITFKVHADTANRTHEFILIAENLGTIPPNTALMRVTADNQVYKLSVKTDLKTNAKIVFYYDGN